MIDGAQLVAKVAANTDIAVATDAGGTMAANKGTYILGSDLFIPRGWAQDGTTPLINCDKKLIRKALLGGEAKVAFLLQIILGRQMFYP